MTKRKKIQLIDFMLSSIERYLSRTNGGLCTMIYEMQREGKIIKRTRDELMNMIFENRPKKFYNALYFYKPGSVKPRIKYLQRLKKFLNQTN